MKFDKKKQDLCEAKYGEGFLLDALYDLHENKHTSYPYKIMHVGEEFDQGVFDKIWKALTSWGRQIFSLSKQYLEGLKWTAIAAVETIPIFIANLKRAAEKLINATAKQITSVVHEIVKNAQILWNYIIDVLGDIPSQLTQVQTQVASLSQIIGKSGDVALRIFHWFGKQLSKFIGAFYSVIEEAVVNVADIAAATMDIFVRSPYTASQVPKKLQTHSYELTLQILTFSQLIPQYKGQDNIVLQEYLDRFGAVFSKQLGQYVSSLSSMVDFTVFSPLLADEYVLAFAGVLFDKVSDIARTIINWVTQRLTWLVRIIRAVRELFVDAFMGMYQRLAYVFTNILDLLHALIANEGLEVPELPFDDKLDLARFLMKLPAVDPEQQKNLSKTIGHTERFLKTMENNQDRNTLANIRSGVKANQATIVSTNTAKLITQLITGEEPDLALGDEITQAMYDKNIEQVVMEMQDIYTLLEADIWLALDSIDDSETVINDEKFAKYFNTLISGKETLWEKIFGKKKAKEEKERVPTREIPPFTKAYEQREKELTEKLDKVRDKIVEEKRTLGNAPIMLRAQGVRQAVEKTSSAIDIHRPGKTKYTDKVIAFHRDTSRLAVNVAREELDALEQKEADIEEELNVLRERESQAYTRIQQRAGRWVLLVLLLVGIGTLIVGGFTYYRNLATHETQIYDDLRALAPAGARALSDFYYRTYEATRGFVDRIIPWQSVSGELLRQQGVILMQTLRNIATNISSRDAFLRDIRPYGNWLNNILSQPEAGEQIRATAKTLLETIEDIAINTEATADQMASAAKAVWAFMSSNNDLLVTGQVPATQQRLFEALSSGVGAVYGFVFSPAYTYEDFTPSGLWARASTGALSSTWTALRSLFAAGIGTIAGFYSLIVMGSYMLILPILFLSEGASQTMLLRLFTSIPVTLAPLYGMMFDALEEASSAVIASRFAYITGALSVGMLLIPGYGPLMMLANVVGSIKNMFGARSPPQAQYMTESTEIYQPGKKTDEKYLKQAEKEAEKSRMLMPPETENKFEEIVRKDMLESREKVKQRVEQTEAQQIVPFKPKKKVIRRRKYVPKQKEEEIESPIKCVVCESEIATVSCTHCANEERQYCDITCVIMDWDSKRFRHNKVLI